MAADIFDASPKALAMIPKDLERKLDTHVDTKTKYKFSQLQLGQCFTLPFAEVRNEQGLRTTVYRAGVKYGRKFAVIKHKEHGLYEVARIG